MLGDMKATIHVSGTLLKRARREGAKRDIPLSGLIEQGLRCALAKLAQSVDARPSGAMLDRMKNVKGDIFGCLADEIQIIGDIEAPLIDPKV
jgi:hypothetical protein